MLDLINYLGTAISVAELYNSASRYQFVAFTKVFVPLYRAYCTNKRAIAAEYFYLAWTYSGMWAATLSKGLDTGEAEFFGWTSRSSGTIKLSPLAAESPLRPNHRARRQQALGDVYGGPRTNKATSASTSAT
jgi:hypothetical protein